MRFVTDGGMETDLIFHHGVELEEFAAFPLLDSADGRDLLTAYYDDYAVIARRAGAGLMLETPTWRASADWGARLGYSAIELARVNGDAVRFLDELRERYRADIAHIRVSGTIGPRGDGYSAEQRMRPDDAADYHDAQVRAFATAGAELVTALTLTHVEEAIGVVRACRAHSMPVGISFTLETDGRLPSGDSLAEAIGSVDEAAPPDYFLINCAHPDHIRAGLHGLDGRAERIRGTRVNASLRSHAELDAAEDLDEGDIPALAAAQTELTEELRELTILGGCCGTDHRHVAAFWGV